MNAEVATSERGQIERPGLHVVWGAATHVGNVRAVNEDSYLATAGMWVVADGMGGHSAGRTASEIVVNTFMERANGGPSTLTDVPSLLDRANQKVRDRAVEEGYETMGTTACGVALVDNGGEDALLVFNLGDSRCYEVVEGGSLVQLTTDHSYVQELVDQGKISSEEARTHPNRNVVSRAIGIEDSVTPDFIVLPKKPESRLLLCSDGVYSELEEAFIRETMLGSDTPSDATARLLAEVVAGPARDNATAVVLDVSWNEAGPSGGNGQDFDDTTIPRDRAPGAGQPVIDQIPGFVANAPAPRLSAPMVGNIPRHMLPTEADA